MVLDIDVFSDVSWAEGAWRVLEYDLSHLFVLICDALSSLRGIRGGCSEVSQHHGMRMIKELTEYKDARTIQTPHGSSFPIGANPFGLQSLLVFCCVAYVGCWLGG
jgi:hypothetical protein